MTSEKLPTDWWGVFLIELATFPSEYPIALFIYCDQAQRWGASNYPGRHEIKSYDPKKKLLAEEDRLIAENAELRRLLAEGSELATELGERLKKVRG